MMKIDILTLFPEMFSPLEHSIVGKAREKGLLDIQYHNFREYAEKARHVDDEPYGGGQGMLLRAQPIFDAFDAIEKKNPRVILLDPAGKQFDQSYAEDLAQEEELIFICGHYEGYDERIKTLVTDEISLGDYVLTGGELAAMTMIDATVRLIPEVIGKESSHQDDSFSSGLLEYPQYTRPYDYRGMVVPDVLMSGHHEKIRQWRLYESLKKTYERRPDLLENYQLTAEEEKMLAEIKENNGEIAEFDPDKIYQAVLKAAQTVYVLTDDLRQNLAQVTKKVVLDLEEAKVERATISMIQSMVEHRLLGAGYITIAEHYISYRLQRDLERSGYGDHIAVHLHFEQIR